MKKTICIILVLVIIAVTPMLLYSDIKDLREKYRVERDTETELTTRQQILKYTGAGLYQLIATSIMSVILLYTGFTCFMLLFLMNDGPMDPIEPEENSAIQRRKYFYILCLLSVPILSLLGLRIIAENIHKMFKL